MGEGPEQYRSVTGLRHAHQPGLAMRSRADQQGRQHRDHREREHQRSRQSEDDRVGHGLEQLAFEAFEREQRQEHDDDDRDARGHRHGHFGDRAKDDVQARLPAAVVGEMAHHVLHHHHRRVDEHADGDGKPAQAHQVRAHVEAIHQDEGDQRGQRQRRRNDHGGAQVAEEQHQQDENEDDRLDQCPRHRSHGAFDQVAAVVEHLGPDARRQQRCKLGKPGPDALDHLLRIGPAQAEHETLHRFRLAVLGD